MSRRFQSSAPLRTVYWGSPLALPSQQELRAAFEYNPHSGALIWKHRARVRQCTNTRYAGTPALACRSRHGYLEGTFNGQLYAQHRIIWKLVTGEEPDEIDHINGDRSDNRFVNLRNVSRGLNRLNTKRQSNNTSGVTGVRWLKRERLWRSEIKLGGKTTCLGYFRNFDEAVRARRDAESRMGFHPNHGRAA